MASLLLSHPLLSSLFSGITISMHSAAARKSAVILGFLSLSPNHANFTFHLISILQYDAGPGLHYYIGLMRCLPNRLSVIVQL